MDCNKQAPEKVRLGVIGLGGRGRGLLSLLTNMDDVYIPAVSDLYEDRMEKAAENTFTKRGYKPELYSDYKKLLERDDIDGVIIPSSWTAHAEIAIEAMNSGKYAAMEVGGASSINECWELVKTSEKTGKPCMMLENCCYGREELSLLHMIKRGMFGELIHCQGGYEHDLRSEVSNGLINRHYRFRNYKNRNGELYPTHELGPIAKYLNINRGNRMLSLTSMASKSRGLHKYIVDTMGADSELAPIDFAQGDIVTTMIKCAHGETIFLIHDTTLPRPYSRGGRVQGTKGIWMEDNSSVYFDGVSPLDKWEPFEKYMTENEHPLWKWYKEEGIRGGHGGMDYLVLRAYVESIKNQTDTPIDVYDTAAWMAITCLSEDSVAMGSMPVSIPDFTNGKWIRRDAPVPGRYCLDLICNPDGTISL